MSTPAQIAASAANAQHSTGPRSLEGKAVSYRNALKFGLYAQSEILPGEDPAEFEQLIHKYVAHYHPEGENEIRLIHDLVRAVWLERRYVRIEAEVIQVRYDSLTPEQREHALGNIFISDAEGANILQKIERRRASAHRQIMRALKEIQRLGDLNPIPLCPPDSIEAPEPPLAASAVAQCPNPAKDVPAPSERDQNSFGEFVKTNPGKGGNLATREPQSSSPTRAAGPGGR
jgi:hypothetical protein